MTEQELRQFHKDSKITTEFYQWCRAITNNPNADPKQKQAAQEVVDYEDELSYQIDRFRWSWE